jgi:predicted house-cleaning noncanonical NTP pyrophosphatase (MazG superfamily)
MRHPFQVAKEIADLIKNDPAAARQVKDYIDPAELLLLLDLTKLSEDAAEELEEQVCEDLEDRILEVIRQYRRGA